MTQTVGLTMKWVDTVAPLCAVIQSGTFEGRKDAIQEVRRMAHVADLAVRQQTAPALDDMPLTRGDTSQALAVVWAALERLELSDDDQDAVNTAMAWITEAVEE